MGSTLLTKYNTETHKTLLKEEKAIKLSSQEEKVFFVFLSSVVMLCSMNMYENAQKDNPFNLEF